uniref:LAGLIDADG_2 domain-containing protein n=1 Tax=Strongyloides papillosus TaxID=174720 RepID=A0A0N5BJL6_STREA
MTKIFKGVIIIVLILIFSIEGRRRFKSQNVAVTAILSCEGKPYENAEIFLVNSLNILRNRMYTLNIKRSDQEGWFVIRGCRKSRYPVRKIYNMCREVNIRVPKCFIFTNWINSIAFDLRNVELSTTPFNRIPCLTG